VHILAAWHPVYSQLMGLGGRIGVCWTSSAGEMDMEPVEREWLAAILVDPRISFIWFGDESLAQVYPEKGFYAPYPLATDIEVPKLLSLPLPFATLFCPTGPKKNVLNQILAMRLVQREQHLTLHTNVQGYDRELAALDCVRYGWLSRPEYESLIASARVNLACSWCETFNYQAAEAALLGTPSVVSPTIPLPGMTVKNPNSPREIADAILRCTDGHGPWARRSMIRRARANNARLREVLAQRLRGV